MALVSGRLLSVEAEVREEARELLQQTGDARDLVREESVAQEREEYDEELDGAEQDDFFGELRDVVFLQVDPQRLGERHLRCW